MKNTMERIERADKMTKSLNCQTSSLTNCLLNLKHYSNICGIPAITRIMRKRIQVLNRRVLIIHSYRSVLIRSDRMLNRSRLIEALKYRIKSEIIGSSMKYSFVRQLSKAYIERHIQLAYRYTKLLKIEKKINENKA